MAACGDCRFYLANPDDVERKLGWCRRFPPVRRVFTREMSGEAVNVEESSFPSVEVTFWCGEYKGLHDHTNPTAQYGFKSADRKPADPAGQISSATGDAMGKGTS